MQILAMCPSDQRGHYWLIGSIITEKCSTNHPQIMTHRGKSWAPVQTWLLREKFKYLFFHSRHSFGGRHKLGLRRLMAISWLGHIFALFVIRCGRARVLLNLSSTAAAASGTVWFGLEIEARSLTQICGPRWLRWQAVGWCKTLLALDFEEGGLLRFW